METTTRPTGEAYERFEFGVRYKGHGHSAAPFAVFILEHDAELFLAAVVDDEEMYEFEVVTLITEES